MFFSALALAPVPGQACGPRFLRWLRRATSMDSRRLAWDSSGYMLLETVLAITIFAQVGAAVFLGVRVAHTSASLVEDHSIAERLARNQIEYVFAQGYEDVGKTYVSINVAPNNQFSVPAGYQVTAVAQQFLVADSYQGSIEKVVVTVSLNGKSVVVLETLRAN